MGLHQTSLFVELGPKLSADFRRLCEGKHVTPGDKLRQLAVQFIEAETGTVHREPRVRLARTARFIMLSGPGPFLISSLAAAQHTSPQNIRYALTTQLMPLGLVREAGFARVAGKGAMTYELTDKGKVWALEEREAETAIAPDKVDLSALRSSVVLFLCDEGFTLPAAKQLVADEEMICYMSDVKMDYTLAYWKQWLKDRRQVEAENAAEEAAAQKA